MKKPVEYKDQRPSLNTFSPNKERARFVMLFKSPYNAQLEANLKVFWSVEWTKPIAPCLLLKRLVSKDIIATFAPKFLPQANPSPHAVRVHQPVILNLTNPALADWPALTLLRPHRSLLYPPRLSQQTPTYEMSQCIDALAHTHQTISTSLRYTIKRSTTDNRALYGI